MTTIERFPAIHDVCRRIAYANGFINRDFSEMQWREGTEEIFGAESVYESDLAKIEAWCATLTDEQREILADGEQSELIALEESSGLGRLLGIFNDVFEQRLSKEPDEPIIEDDPLEEDEND